MNTIMLPAGNGKYLILKDINVVDDRMFCMYKSTYNDMPFQETELYIADEGKSAVICGDDGTVLYRIPISVIINSL